MIHYVCGFMFCMDTACDEWPEGRVWLVQRNRPAWQRGYYNGIGGKVWPGEDPSESMAREFTEESGVKIPSQQWRNFCRYEVPNIHRVDFFFYYATESEFDSVYSAENKKAAPFPIDHLPKKCIWNLNWLIPMALDVSLFEDKFPILIHGV